MRGVVCWLEWICADRVWTWALWAPELQACLFLHCITFNTSSPAFCRISVIKAFCSTHAQQSQPLSPTPTARWLSAHIHLLTHQGTAAFGPHWFVHSKHLADKLVPEFTGVQGFDLKLITYLDNVWERGGLEKNGHNFTMSVCSSGVAGKDSMDTHLLKRMVTWVKRSLLKFAHHGSRREVSENCSKSVVISF